MQNDELEALKSKLDLLHNEIQKLTTENLLKNMRIEILQETIDEMLDKKRKFSFRNLLKWR